MTWLILTSFLQSRNTLVTAIHFDSSWTDVFLDGSILAKLCQVGTVELNIDKSLKINFKVFYPFNFFLCAAWFITLAKDSGHT